MIVATVGHIDHGKTELVKKLTGINTDRLPEEKDRGISIDLGFAYHDFGNGSITGFVDVPGHERFINNMLAGISSIDLGLLVVAADDGPMTQTYEHLSILELLGVKKCVIVLTKIDLVETSQLFKVNIQINKLIQHTTFSKSKIFKVSNKTLEGINDLIYYFKKNWINSNKRKYYGNFRLSVDRRFLVKGSGIVLTGSVISGKVNIGDKLIHSATGRSLKVRSIHTLNKVSKVGYSGQRCSLNIISKGINLNDFSRGDWILNDKVNIPTKRLDAKLNILKNEKENFKHWTPVHIHIGSANFVCYVALLKNAFIIPGGIGFVQLVFDKPIFALFGDHFVIRDISSRRTIGGGLIIDPFSVKRKTFNERQIQNKRLMLMNAESTVKVLNNLLQYHVEGISADIFSVSRNLTNNELEKILFDVDIVRAFYVNNKWLLLKKNLIYFETLVLDLIAKQQIKKLENGTDIYTLLVKAKINVPNFVIKSIIDKFIKSKKLIMYNNLLYEPNFFPKVDNYTLKWPNLEKQFIKYKFQPPKIAEISKQTNIELKELEFILNKASRKGHLFKINNKRYILSQAIYEIVSIIEKMILEDKNYQLAIKDFTSKTNIPRSLSIEILEYFDEIGFTKRIKDVRVLKQ